MARIEEIIQLKLKPKEIQIKLVEAVTQKKIPAGEFIAFFKSASDVATLNKIIPLRIDINGQN